MSKIIQFKDKCISCGSCVEYAPNYWQMGKDGRAELLRSKEKNGKSVLDICEFEIEQNKDASNACPVDAIQILDDSGNKIN
jgi:ferredoxin